ncbi:MAG TPA: hypothetical protein PKG52_04925, partial [bacterium]|nr:hypothetical protein [bacterium]
MKKIIVTTFLFICLASCGTDDADLSYEEGGSCGVQGEEQCNGDKSAILICQNLVWTVKKLCNINFDESCRFTGTVYSCSGSGDTGDTGNTGDTGDTGNTGDTGDTGNTG